MLPGRAATNWRCRRSIIAGDRRFLDGRARHLGLQVPTASVAPAEAAGAFASALPVVDTGIAATAEPGRPDDTSAPAAIASIRHAVDDVRAGRASAVVTNPIAKSVLYRAGFKHPGHTEFLAELAADGSGCRTAAGDDAVVADACRHPGHHPCGPARRHRAADDRDIVETCTIAANELKRRFGIATPRIAVSGLNPHAGEDGSLGSEDIEIVALAVAHLRNAGIDARGPLPADTMFHEAARKTYDCAVCMYHDQALIPIKTLAFDDAVNVTLGLPFIRTSPDHGTAFDIAGTGRASPSSLIAALRLAARMAALAGR